MGEANEEAAMSDDIDRTELLNYVEQFAQVAVDAGMQRMTARVFSYVLADDASTYTAAELAEGLGVSLAAISTAVRELVTAGLLIKQRRPDTRADVYAINDDDIWGKIMLDRTPLLDKYRYVAMEGVDLLPPGPGRDRMRQTAMFMDYMKTELQGIRDRWNEFREQMPDPPAARVEDKS
jgi:predicted transcriptional regulator